MAADARQQIRQIADSIKTFSFNVPILTDRGGKVVAGHGRLRACRLLGITEVPTLYSNNPYAVSSYGIRVGEVRILSPTPAMIIAGVTASPLVM